MNYHSVGALVVVSGNQWNYCDTYIMPYEVRYDQQDTISALGSTVRMILLNDA